MSERPPAEAVGGRGATSRPGRRRPPSWCLAAKVTRPPLLNRMQREVGMKEGPGNASRRRSQRPSTGGDPPAPSAVSARSETAALADAQIRLLRKLAQLVVEALGPTKQAAP
jgi:hypothetical protein